MSLLPALDESDSTKHHGWNSSSRFGMDSTVNNQEGSSTLYHHLINQNNTGTVPDAVQQEEVVPQNGPGQICQTDFGQGHQVMSPQRFNQVKQQPRFQSHPQQLVNHPQQQVINNQQQQQHSVHSPQQHSVRSPPQHSVRSPQQHMVRSPQPHLSHHPQVVHSGLQHVVGGNPRHPQQHATLNNIQPQVVNSPLHHSQQQTVSRPQGHVRPMLNRTQMHQQHVPRQQFHAKQNPHSLQQPQQVSPGPEKKVVYTVVHRDGKRIEIPTEPLNTYVQARPQLQNVQVQHQQRETTPVQQSNNGSPLNQVNNSLKVNEEEILDQALMLQQQKIAENNKMLAVYQQLGLTTSNVAQSPQVQTSLSTAPSPGNTNMNISTTSQSQAKSMEFGVTDSNGATNQTKPVLQLNPGGSVNTQHVLGGQRHNTYVQQGLGPKTVPPGLNYKGGGGSTRVHQNPVQVSSISSNQIPPSPSVSGPGNKINKDNVVLEGGGQFEEGQLYVIKDKKGQVQTMQWRHGDFVPVENSKIIQHQVVDSSQRGRGSSSRGGRGRGRGQNQLMPPSPQGVPGGVRFPGAQQIVRQTLDNRGPNNSLRQDLNNHPANQFRQTRPKTLIIQTTVPQISSPDQGVNVSVPVTGTVVTLSQQTPILNMVTLKNLMPPAQGSQKTAHSSGTNLARDIMSQDEKEEPDKDLSQSSNTSISSNSQGDKTEVPDPPRIPNDPNAVAVCQFCGYVSEDKIKCESCRRRFTSTTKYQIKGSGVPINTDKPPQKKRKSDNSAISDGINKKSFYSKKTEEQNNLYTTIIHSANGPPTLTVTYPRNPRIIMRRGGRSRGRGRGRGVFISETITLSSDEEDGEPNQKLAADTNNSSQRKSPSQPDPSTTKDSPDVPIDIPVIPISSSRLDNRVRCGRMENEAGKSRTDREKSVSPVHVLLAARNVTVGTFRGIPLEPIVLCKNGLRFFVEGKQGSHRFSIFPPEIQQCLAHFSNKSSSYLFFLVSEMCGLRTRKDLGIKEHTDANTAPPDPYFDPFGAVLTHQMITVIMDKVDVSIVAEFQKYMDTFKSGGKQGDEAFFMELTEQEADEVRKQSLKKMIVVAPQAGVLSQPMAQDHQYSQHGEEDRRSRSPSPPRIGFQGTVVKLLTYPPPPEKRGISITNEDLYCLQEGEFLNDVIIDFYLKYLHMEKMSERDRERTHIFSSFFYKRLTQRIRGAAIDDDPNLGLPEKRHARVKTWTRHVDLFKKDFIVIPINEHAHWFLAIICYPWLIEPVENKYIPNRPNTPTIDSQNIPTPPQPTDENAEDPETEEPENPSTEEKSEEKIGESTNTQPTKSETNSQSTQDSEASAQEDKQEKETAPESKQENMEVEQNEITSEDPLKTDSEEMDTSEKPDETVVDKGEETNQEKVDTATETPVLSKQAIYRGLQAIKPIRGQSCGEGDSSVEDVMTGIKQPCILIFDSLSGPSRSRIVTVLKEYLQVEWQAKKATEAERALNKAIFRGCVPKVPQQNNYSDCGVFMLQYVESFFEDPIQDFTTPMKGLHDWFTTQKIEGKREELKDLVISLKEKYESKPDAADNT